MACGETEAREFACSDSESSRMVMTAGEEPSGAREYSKDGRALLEAGVKFTREFRVDIREDL